VRRQESEGRCPSLRPWLLPLCVQVDVGKVERETTKAALQEAEKRMNQVLTQMEKAAVAQRKAGKQVEHLKAELLELAEKEKQSGASLAKKQALLKSALDATGRMEVLTPHNNPVPTTPYSPAGGATAHRVLTPHNNPVPRRACAS
jgi:hypothetical protein